MLCGSTISGVVLSLNYVLNELHANRDKIETYLAFGASRAEACRPIAKAALRTALTPSVNQMSVLGLISIPGMMTGALLGGASVQQAARLQMIIMFMISAATALASIVCTTLALGIVVDAEARVRAERLDPRKAAVWRARDHAVEAVGVRLKTMWEATRRRGRESTNGHHGEHGERDPLLG
jgi:ABC-type iron transport system FetAB permease component